MADDYMPVTLPQLDRLHSDISTQTYYNAPIHPLTRLCYAQLGDGMTRGDGKHGWLLLKFVDALCESMKPVWDLVTDTASRPGWWSVFDADADPGQVLPYLPWMAQFVGVVYDGSLNRRLTIDDPTTVNPDQLNRDRVKQLVTFKRGSADALKQVVLERMMLAGIGANVAVIERDGGNPSVCRVVCYCAQMPEVLEQNIVQALAAALPAGDRVIFEPRLGATYAQTRQTLRMDTLAERKGGYPRFGDATAAAPPVYAGPLPSLPAPTITYTPLPKLVYSTTPVGNPVVTIPPPADSDGSTPPTGLFGPPPIAGPPVVYVPKPVPLPSKVTPSGPIVTPTPIDPPAVITPVPPAPAGSGLPGVPTNVTVDVTDTSMQLHFSAPTDDGGSPITEYVYGRDGSDSMGGGVWDVPPGTVTTPGTVGLAYLIPATTYNVYIYAKNANGPGAKITLTRKTTGSVTSTPVNLPGLVWSEEFTGSDFSYANSAGTGGTWRTSGENQSLDDGYVDYAGSSFNAPQSVLRQHGLITVANSIATFKAIRNPGGLPTDAAWISPYVITDVNKQLYWNKGYFEFRARFPNPCLGMFPALWLFRNSDGLAPAGKNNAEIDLLEIFGKREGKPWATGYHHVYGSDESNICEDWDTDPTQWHRYGLKWTDNELSAWCDGKYVGGVTGYPTSWFNDVSMCIRIDYVMDPNWDASIRSTSWDPPAGFEPRMEVDYVRVYDAMPSNLPIGSADPLGQ